MRLDQKIVDLGFAPTRARARDLVKRGFVTVAGAVCDKPSRDVGEALDVQIAADAPHYVSRGAEKLAAAIDHFGFVAQDLIALDVGASTGGFTEVMLLRGARRVYAVDVGAGQLHERLKADARVIAFEQLDARQLSNSHIGESVGAIVADVSFISLTKAIAPALALAAPGAWLIALIKPQFEVGPDRVGKGGIVRDQSAVRDAVAQVRAWFEAQSGWQVIGTMPSPILGGSGNAEFLIAARRDA